MPDTEEALTLENDLRVSDLFTLYWNYYQYHAGVRMKILELYIGFMTALFGAYIVALDTHPKVAVAAGFAIGLISFFCVELDSRTKNLLHLSRIALRKLEDSCIAEQNSDLKLFQNVKAKETGFTFSAIFFVAYAVTSFLGLLCVGYALFRL